MFMQRSVTTLYHNCRGSWSNGAYILRPREELHNVGLDPSSIDGLTLLHPLHPLHLLQLAYSRQKPKVDGGFATLPQPTGCATRLCAASAAESECIGRYQGCWKPLCTPD